MPMGYVYKLMELNLIAIELVGSHARACMVHCMHCSLYLIVRVATDVRQRRRGTDIHTVCTDALKYKITHC